jgi:hypothetical protein
MDSGWALVRQVLPRYRSAWNLCIKRRTREGARATTGLGAGTRYDFNENYHLLAYAGRGLQNAVESDRYSWYVSILFTF